MEVRERVQDIGPLDVRDYLAAAKANGLSTAALKEHMAAIRMLFDHLVTGGLIENPALWGTLEKARQMAVHASTRATQLYDRREDRVTLDEVVIGGRPSTANSDLVACGSRLGELTSLVGYWPKRALAVDQC